MTSLYLTESGCYVHKRGGHVVVGRNNEIIMEIPIERLEDITVIDSVQISSAMMTELLERKIPMTWISGMGKYFGTLLNPASVDIIKHQKQFELLQSKVLYFAIAKKVVLAKVHNQLTILRRYNRNLENEAVLSSIKNILAIRKNIFRAENTHELMGYEGIISRVYFDGLGKIIPAPFDFNKRTRQPPLDPVNSMLSLGYSMLFNEVLAAIISVGLHPYVGFLHAVAKGHPALVSDLMEEWRAVIVDAMVLAIVKRNMIPYELFEITDAGCFLNYEARKVFLREYNKKLKSDNQYLDEKCSFRESIKKQCARYASALMNEDIERYTPLELR